MREATQTKQKLLYYKLPQIASKLNHDPLRNLVKLPRVRGLRDNNITINRNLLHQQINIHVCIRISIS